MIVYLGKGDTALSVTMTAISTLLAPFLTPLLILWLADEALDIGFMDLFASILQVVLVPVLAVMTHNLLGLLLGYGAAKLARLDRPARRALLGVAQPFESGPGDVVGAPSRDALISPTLLS